MEQLLLKFRFTLHRSLFGTTIAEELAWAENRHRQLGIIVELGKSYQRVDLDLWWLGFGFARSRMNPEIPYTSLRTYFIGFDKLYQKENVAR